MVGSLSLSLSFFSGLPLTFRCPRRRLCSRLPPLLGQPSFLPSDYRLGRCTTSLHVSSSFTRLPIRPRPFSGGQYPSLATPKLNPPSSLLPSFFSSAHLPAHSHPRGSRLPRRSFHSHRLPVPRRYPHPDRLVRDDARVVLRRRAFLLPPLLPSSLSSLFDPSSSSVLPLSAPSFTPPPLLPALSSPRSSRPISTSLTFTRPRPSSPREASSPRRPGCSRWSEGRGQWRRGGKGCSG